MAEDSSPPINNQNSPEDQLNLTNEIDSKDEKAIKEIELIESDDALDNTITEQKINLPKKTHWFKSKKIYIPSIVIILIGLLFVLPYTRYAILGQFLSEKYSITLVDSQTMQPVIGGVVNVGGKIFTSDNSGKVTLKIKVGNKKIFITKKYYAALQTKIFVPVSQKKSLTISLVATGRQVSVLVTNKIGKNPVPDVIVSGSGSSGRTNSSGLAYLVLPTDKKIVSGSLSGSGFIKQTISINLSGVNNYSIVPSGSIYYLSNTSGKVDVVKSNLDGSNQTTVLEGNSSEGIYNTALYPSKDWNYLGLVANRNNLHPCLSIIQISNNANYIVDSTNGNYNVVGWDSNNNLIYTVQNNNLPSGSIGEYELKSYNSSTNLTKVLYQTGSQTIGINTVNEMFDSVNLLPNNSVIYSTSWVGNTSLFSGLIMNVTVINDNNTGQKTLQQFTQSNFSSLINAHFSSPSSLIFWLYPLNGNIANYYHYVNDQLEPVSSSSSIIANLFSTPNNYYLSASGLNVTYSNNVNGHSAIYSADSKGNNPKQLALLDNTFSPYAWYTDNYIILNKNYNEFYILPSSGVTDQPDLLKISDHL